MNNFHRDISKFSANIGKDRLLVQGSGGNISWKDGNILWIKGSGAWLANADKEDIFVPVDLKHLQDALMKKQFDIKPQLMPLQGGRQLRPSIETILHALMPQKIVLHLHAVNILSYLVIKDCEKLFKRIMASSPDAHLIDSILVDYHKPGSELAQAVQRNLIKGASINVAFLKNHGIVVGADSIHEIYALLSSINKIFISKQNPQTPTQTIVTQVITPRGYIPFLNDGGDAIALNQNLYRRLQSDWALFPDHVVFLGPKAFTFDSWAAFLMEKIDCDPEIIFIKNSGVFIKPTFNDAKRAQLLCYFDVMSRIANDAVLDSLDAFSVSALLNWDAEQYRVHLAK